MTTPVLNPVEAEQRILELSNRIAKGVAVVTDALKARDESARNFDKEYAAAFLGAEGAVKEREMRASLLTMPAREEKELAEAAYRYSDRLAKALELELRALQSVGASVRAMYSVAGRGE